MTAEDIRALKHAKPFKPFVIHLNSGKKVRVAEEGLMAISPAKTYLAIFEPDDSMHWVWLTDIHNITFAKKKARTK